MDFTEKTVSQNPVFQGRIIAVHNDEVTLPNGKSSQREVVEHSGGVMVAPLTDQGELIFVRQFRYPYHTTLLELPAGKLEPGEEPFQTGVRELQEEVGACAKTFLNLGKLYPTPAYCSEIIHMYAAKGLTFGDQALDEDEFLEVEKIPLDTAVEMVLNNEIVDAKTQAAVLKVFLLRQRGKF